MKVARTVWSGGKGGDYFKTLPIAISEGSEPFGNKIFEVKFVQITQKKQLR